MHAMEIANFEPVSNVYKMFGDAVIRAFSRRLKVKLDMMIAIGTINQRKAISSTKRFINSSHKPGANLNFSVRRG